MWQIFPLFTRFEKHPTGGWNWDFWSINSMINLTPPKVNMEPENDGVQKESPFPGTSFVTNKRMRASNKLLRSIHVGPPGFRRIMGGSETPVPSGWFPKGLLARFMLPRYKQHKNRWRSNPWFWAPKIRWFSKMPFFSGDKFNAKPEQKMSWKNMPSRKDSVSVFGKISVSWLTNMLGLAGGIARQAACFGYASCVFFMIRLYEYVNWYIYYYISCINDVYLAPRRSLRSFWEVELV